MDGSFGDVLKSLRLDAGLTSYRAAGRALNMSHTHVWAMEHGDHIPHPDLVEKLDKALGADGQLIAAYRRGQVLNPDERTRLHLAAENPYRLDPHAVTSLADVLHAQRRLDDAIGAHPLLEPVASYMTRIEAMLRGARGPIREQALLVAAEWAQFAGWINTASENWDTAEGWFAKGLAWSAECGDQDMTATLLSYRGHAAWLQGHVPASVGLAEAARRNRDVYVGQLAYDCIQQARGLAVLGEVREAESLLAEAVDLTGPAVEQLDGAPPWHYYRSKAAWDAELGRAYLYVPGWVAEAARLLADGLANIPEAGVEWMRSYHDDLARARKLSA